MNDLNSIRDAFKGCTHIFANTAFNGPALISAGQEAAEKLERDQGMNLVRAAADTVSLEHFVWSTLTDCSLPSGHKWKVPHFMSKQAANAYILGGYPGDGIREQQQEPGWGSLRDRSTLMAIGMYGSNLQFHAYRPVKKVSVPVFVVYQNCDSELMLGSGLPELTATDLGVNDQLVSSSKFYNKLDCLALMKEVESGTTRLGSAGRK